MNSPLNPQQLELATCCTATAPAIVDTDSDTHDFDWIDDRADVVVEQQPTTAIYTNPSGAIVIRQEAFDLDDEDKCVYFRPENLDPVIRRLVELRDKLCRRADGGRS